MDQQTAPVAADSPPLAPRLTLRGVVHDAAKHFFDVENGWLRTVRDLTIAPGPMIRRYVGGHRSVYANPFAYLVLATAVSFVVQKLVGFDDRMVATVRANTMESPLQMEFVNRFTELMLQNSLYISFGVLVPLALLIRIFFCKSGYNLAESFVFALYSGGHTTLLTAVLVPLYMLLPPSTAIQGIVSVVVAIIYMMYAARGFFPGSFVFVAIKTGVAYVIAYSVFMVVMMVGVITYIFMVLVPTASGVDWDLVTATENKAIPVIEKLLDEGADVNMTLQRTALHAAAEHGNLEVVELLIEGGADLNLQDIHGRVPMMVAITAHHPDIARYLAEAGTDPHVRANDGATLLLAASRTEDVELIQWALDHGTDVNATRPTKTSATALMMAARKGNAEIVRLLLASGADPSLTNHKGQTALDLAKGREVKELLLNDGLLPAGTITDTNVTHVPAYPLDGGEAIAGMIDFAASTSSVSGLHSAQTLPKDHERAAVTNEGFRRIETTTTDPKCLQECLRENQQAAVGYEELERRCRQECEVTRALMLVRSDDPEEYAEGIEILCDSDDRRAVEVLITALRRDLKERTGRAGWIIPALGTLRDPAAVPVLIETLEIPDENWFGREMSARALGDIGDPSAIPALTAAAWRGDTRDDAVMALAGILDSRVIPVLVSALDPGEDPETREAATEGLRRLGSIAVSELVEALGEYAPEHPETKRRIWICELLGEIGDPHAMEALQAHRSDPDPAVALCAARFTGN